MEWIKVPTDNVLYSEFKDSDLIAMIKYQALYCQIEKEPTLVQMKRVLNTKQIKFVLNNTEVVQELVKNQIKTVQTKRNRDKESYQSKQILNSDSVSEKKTDSKLISDTDKIRLDKIRLDKKNIIKDNIPFGDFYCHYPRRVARAGAEKAWNKLSNTDREKAIEVVKSDKFKEWVKEQDIKYIKHPATWLNNSCWEDDIEINAPVKKNYSPIF